MGEPDYVAFDPCRSDSFVFLPLLYELAVGDALEVS
jgi:hypothetical protein